MKKDRVMNTFWSWSDVMVLLVEETIGWAGRLANEQRNEPGLNL